MPPPQKELLPHPHTLPSLFNAKLESERAPTAVTLLSVVTGTADKRIVVVPSPNWPALLSPQAQTVASLFSASEWPKPAATRVNAPASGTRTGALRPEMAGVTLPVPSCA